jgi:hypothetical protein
VRERERESESERERERERERESERACVRVWTVWAYSLARKRRILHGSCCSDHY